MAERVQVTQFDSAGGTRWLRGATAALLLAALIATQAAAGEEYRHGISFLTPLKYPPGFQHFDYVNPDAPKGGEIRTSRMGTFDSFNNFIHKGTVASGVGFYGGLLYDRMLEKSADEPTAHYGRLAESVALAEDGSWVAFRMRPEARWHDGTPLDADDVVWSFRTFKEYGSPDKKTVLAPVVDIEKLGPHEVRYRIDTALSLDPNIPMILGSLPVLPEHYWATRDVTRTTVEPPLGSGPYRIAEVSVGRYLIYERVKDYWGRDLPVNRGRYNFDRVKYDYFRDENIMFEAEKANVIDFREETIQKYWMTLYDFPAAQMGLFRKQVIEYSRPSGLWWPIFWNLDRERFRDRRVRQALWLLYDFDWFNRVLTYYLYDHGTSFFYHSNLASSGLPSERELELLEPFRDQLPPELFEQPYEPPRNSGYGLDRSHLLRANELFRDAGWEIRDGKLTHRDTGEVFRIDFVVVSPALVGVLLPYMAILEKVGIETNARSPEVSNWLHRMRIGNFDGGMITIMPTHTPGLMLRNSFSSEVADMDFGTNWAKIRNPVVDALIDRIIGAQTEEDHVAAIHALDRVLLWNFYFIPGMAKPNELWGYWDKFGFVETEPLERNVILDTWWWDEEKARRVAEGVAALEAEQEE